MRRIYADYAATTPTSPEVVAAMLPYYSPEFGNPSSMHESGLRAARAAAAARARVARVLNAQPGEIIFTGSGTESDNLAVFGVARAYAARGTHIIVSAIEHKAVVEPARRLEREGFEVTWLQVDSFGRVDFRALSEAIRSDTTLISIMLGNNEIGTVQPIQETAALLKERRGSSQTPLLHTDACQAAGHLDLSVEKLGVDLMSLNGSKIYGPKGVGVLYKRRDVTLEPRIVGGSQEHGLRAGTESLPLMAGMAEALERAEAMRTAEHARLVALSRQLVKGLRARIPNILINGHPSERLPHIVHVTVPAVEGESMVLMLDEVGVEAATGSACSSNDLKPSHVLSAIGQPDDLMHGSVRFSFGRGTTLGDIRYILKVFPPIVERLRRASALTAHVRIPA